MPIGQVSQQVNFVAMALAGAQRIFELLDEEPEVDEGYVTLVNATEDADGTIHETDKHTGTWAWKHFHKEDGRLGYHFIQSFNGKEVSAEECNDIGVELAESLWGDKYQVLVCTHIDKDNVHNHIILNSVSFVDGCKYHNSKVELALLRQTNDDLCRKYGLSVIETEKAEKENGATCRKPPRRRQGAYRRRLYRDDPRCQ